MKQSNTMVIGDFSLRSNPKLLIDYTNEVMEAAFHVEKDLPTSDDSIIEKLIKHNDKDVLMFARDYINSNLGLSYVPPEVKDNYGKQLSGKSDLSFVPPEVKDNYGKQLNGKSDLSFVPYLKETKTEDYDFPRHNEECDVDEHLHLRYL